MIINIDTNEESAQNLRRIAAFLESLAQKHDSYDTTPSVFEQSEPQQEAASSEAFDMFDMSSDRPSEVQKPKPKDDDSDDGFRMIPY